VKHKGQVESVGKNRQRVGG